MGYKYEGFSKNLVFTLLSITLLINSFNYIDGIDGLLSGITITSLSYLTYLVFAVGDGDQNIIKLLLTVIIAVSINLVFNFLPNKNKFKTFTGNAGSLFIGFFISFLIIFLYKYKGIHPAYLIWTCWYPVYDFLYVTLNRIKNNKKFFRPDKTHFHHKVLLLNKNSHLKSFLIISILNITIIIFGFFISIYFGKLYSLISYTILFFIFSVLRFKLLN